jgi:hypothetical protein
MASEIAMEAIGRSMLNWADGLRDFEDTAAAIGALDLVIAVDTAVLHLAGALGKPAWALLPSPCDFRWLDARDDSPWYPTMRLFRQKRRNDWTDVIERLAVALRAELNPKRENDCAVTMPVAFSHRRTVNVPDAGAAPGVAPELFAMAVTRLGLMQYRPADTPIGRSLDWYGEYLQPQLDLLARILRPGGTVVEVGAGIGGHSVVLASLLGTKGHLMVYEDDPLLRRVLQQNLAAAGASNVTVMQRMLGGSRMTDAAKDSVIAEAAKNHHSVDVGVVETLDELRLPGLQMLKLNDLNVGLDVLRNATATLWRLRPMVFASAGDEPTFVALANYVQEYGYRRWKVVTPLFNAKNFNRRDNDIFAGRSAVALLAIPEEMEIADALTDCAELR